MIKYMGGKFRHSKAIAELLESLRNPGQMYFEPFVGGAWVIGKMSGVRVGSDTNEALINYYKAVQSGYMPPDSMSEEEYKDIKHKIDVNDPITVFAMLACSFGGKWAGGYARGNCDYCKTGKRASLKYRSGIEGVLFLTSDYRVNDPQGWLIYYDPPYANTTAYKGQPKFNHDEFWDIMREWSKRNTVIISEYTAPDDFECIKEFEHRQHIRSKQGSGKTSEKLFRLKQ